MTSTFFSTLSSDYEKRLKDEIYGCFKYIGIPIETVYNMPIQDRKYFIQKHNSEQEEASTTQAEMLKKNSGTISSNADLNSYARLQQSNDKNGINF